MRMLYKLKKVLKIHTNTIFFIYKKNHAKRELVKRNNVEYLFCVISILIIIEYAYT